MAAAILAMLAPTAVNIGIDNVAVVKKGNEIIEHLRRREKERRKDERGVRMLGGRVSILHRPTPYKQKWAQMKDGDLWEVFADIASQRGPWSVTITKVKGHATQEMVDEGKVDEEEKKSNDGSDEAADLGATESQGRVAKFASLYSWRHQLYRQRMTRVQKYVVGLKKEDRRLREEDEKERDPFEKKEGRKVKVEKQLRYAETNDEVVQMKMKMIERHWCRDEEETRYTRKVQSFLGKLEWGKKDREEEGGCAWVELYAMYTIHG